MPLSRYQIRNEYSLADPELYRAADKDDPEALLEGVAMAGLVGVLRQLGDLAEFAAEIFHNLHEEVMATAARGHGLVVRAQQLEAEFPSIEKAFLSQTNHSLLFYNLGTDWHPNLHMDQNLITRGDLPRFIMDSYEECRGPPQLFLLDKFDVAGAGTCLKRYTDPSFYKVETSSSGMTNAEVQREKRARKAKKKGSHRRNVETPEVLPASHAKLHQLFLEERVENGVSDPARLVKLKRRLNGFPFDLKSGKSYMEKFLKTPSPEHKVVHEISVGSPPLKLPSNISGQPGLEMLDISTVSPDKESVKTRSPRSFSNVDRNLLKSSTDELLEDPSDGEIPKVPKPNPTLEAHNILSTHHEVVHEKEIAVDGEIKTECNIDGYQSDDIASEIDNYMDALTTMESELETETEFRAKTDTGLINIENQGIDSDANEEQLQTHFSDSQSIGNSIALDDGNTSSRKGISSFSGCDSPSSLAESTPLDDDTPVKVFPSTDFCEAEISDISSDELSVNEEVPVNQSREHVVPNGECYEVPRIPSYRSEVGEPSSGSCLTDSAPIVLSEDPGAILTGGTSVGLELDDMSSNHDELDAREDENNLDGNLPCTSNLSDVSSLITDDFPPTVSAESHPVDDVENDGPNVFSDDSIQLSNVLEVASEGKISINSVDILQTEYAENCSNNLVDSQISSPRSVISHTEDIKPGGIVSGDDDAIPSAGEIAVNLASAEDSPDPHNFTEKQISEITDDVLPLELISEVGVSSSGETNLDGALSIADGEEMGGTTSNMGLVESDAVALEFPSDFSGSADPAPLTDIHVHFNERETGTVQSESVVLAATVAPEFPSDIFNSPDPASSAGVSVYLDEKETKIVQSEAVVVAATVAPECPSDILNSSDPAALSEVHVHSDQKETDRVQLEAVVVAPTVAPEFLFDFDIMNFSDPVSSGQAHLHSDAVAATDAGSADDAEEETVDSLSVNCRKLREESLSCLDNSNQNGLEIREAYLPKNHEESGARKEMNQQLVALQDSDSVVCNEICNDHGKLEVLDSVHDSYLAAETGNSFYVNDTSTDLSPSTNDGQYLESKSPQQNDHIENSGDALSLPTHHFRELKVSLQQNVELQADQLVAKTRHAGEASSESFSQLEQTQASNHMDHNRCFDVAPELCTAQSSTQPSVSDVLPQSVGHKLDISEQNMDSVVSTFPGFGLLSETTQSNLEEMPPLPPLPPVQWRIGKPQQASLASERDVVQHNIDSFPHFPSTAVEKAQLGYPAVEGQIMHSSNPFLPLSDAKYENPQHVYEQLPCNVVHSSPFSFQLPAMAVHGDSQDDFLNFGRTQSMNLFLTLPAANDERLRHGFHAGDGTRQPSLIPFSPVTSNGVTVSTHASRSLHENLIQPLHQLAPKASLEDETLEQNSSISEVKVVNSPDTTVPPPNIKGEQPQHAFPTSEGEIAWSSSTSSSRVVEEGKLNGNRPTKLPRPRNPLIDAVCALDKSKLRKVTERVRPQIEKADERGSLLEQIRTKSFNLKPAAVTRPSIQGPKTNLKVAAILEKANSIRQALAGSDEDDDGDSWSDS